MLNLTPKEIVIELDRYIIGQNEAKKAVAIALRNRYRRKQVENVAIRNEIIPHNILMVGPTGVGKTEISRRLANLTSSPFIKIDATKFTEVGYVGRDVDSIIRDLIEVAIMQIKEKTRDEVVSEVHDIAEEKLISQIVGENASEETKKKFLEKFRAGQLDDQEVQISLIDHGNSMKSIDIPGAQLGVFNLGDILGKALGSKKIKNVKMKVPEAFQAILNEESEQMINEEQVIKNAITLVENDGIVFIDEIDKIANRSNNDPGVSREGVQRDLLPLIDGTTVNTKYGAVKTHHILFIASGAFHVSKPSDLLPELQGRLPVKVNLQPLTEEEMCRILIEREYNLPQQYIALLAVDNIELEFTNAALKLIAKITTQLNEKIENIGARRLQSIIEKILEEISFNGNSKCKRIKYVIDEDYVNKQLKSVLGHIYDMQKFIL